MTNRKILFVILTFAISTSLFGADYFEAPQKYERSGRSYTELAPNVSGNRGNAEWLYDLAQAYYEGGKLDDSFRYMRMAWELKPNMAFLNAKMADLFMVMGERDSALVYYENALNNHYEYIEVWEKIVELKPEYYANLGLLYNEKSEEHEDDELLRLADRYLNLYLDRFPEGEFAGQARTAIQRIELVRRQRASRRNLQESVNTAQAEEARKKAELKADRENFRTEKPWLAGFGFYSLVLSEDHDFVAKNPDEVVEDTLSMKHYAPNLNEFGIAGGYVTGPLILRAVLNYGSTSSGKNYFYRDPVPWSYEYDIDSSSTPWDSVKTDSTVSTKDDIRPKVNSVNTIRLSAAADYNFYYMNPILLYFGANADFGMATIKEPYDNFESITLAGAGLGGGIMLRFSDFLFDLSYRRNVVGSSAGGVITLMGIYKF